MQPSVGQLHFLVRKVCTGKEYVVPFWWKVGRRGTIEARYSWMMGDYDTFKPTVSMHYRVVEIVMDAEEVLYFSPLVYESLSWIFFLLNLLVML